MQTPQNWQTAKQETLALWLRIREMVDDPDEIELLTEINAICALCEVAKADDSEVADSEADDSEVHGRCAHCLAYQQFGGCGAVNGEMSELVAERDWNGLSVMVDRFVESLRGLEVPPLDEPLVPLPSPGQAAGDGQK